MPAEPASCQTRAASRRAGRVPALACVWALAAACGCSLAPDPPRGVVLVVIDTLRADHLGVYGYARPTSPRMDAFAADAVLFRRALTPSPWTLPALGTLMTSLYPSVHGARRPSALGAWGQEGFEPRSALHESRLTLAEILRDEGFQTLGIVRGAYATDVFGIAQGFDRYSQNDTPGVRFDVENALAWLDEEQPRRFLVYLHVVEVHAPYTPVQMPATLARRRPDAPFERFRAGVAEEQERFAQIDFDPGYQGPVDGSLKSMRKLRHAGDDLDPRDLEHLIALYDRGIRYTDHWIGELLDGLAARGLLDESLVVLTSDHGEEFREHGRFEHSRAYYEESLRVPLIVRVPGEGRGVVVDAPVGLVDVLPTVLDVLGLHRDYPFQGRSLRPLWKGGELPERDLFGEASSGPRSDAIVSGDWKYIRTRRAHEELYDLRGDPGERVNRCASEPVTCEAHRLRLDAWRAGRREVVRELGLPKPEPVEVDDETLEQLRELGYVE